MRLLHTSDWHLGQTFHGYERHYEHQCFLQWLLDTLEHEQIDALLIAGDIFDNANPSAAALHQFYRFLRDAKTRLPELSIVVVAGNHDSPFRLEAPSPLLSALNVTVVGQVNRNDANEIDQTRLVVPLRDQTGKIRTWCLAVPFLRSSDLPGRADAEAVGSATDAGPNGDAYSRGVAAVYRQALAAAEVQREAGQSIIALGHCHLHGGEVSADSERRIVIGGIETLPVSIFAETLAYVGLGHLHRAQIVGGNEQRRYSGSPLPLSFSEKDYRHQVVRVELRKGETHDIRPLVVPRAVELLRVPEMPLPLPAVLESLEKLALSPVELQRQPYLEIKVRLDQPEPGLRSKIESALQGKPVRLTRIETRYPDRSDEKQVRTAPTLDDIERLRPEDIFVKLYHQRYATAPANELLAAFNELLTSSSEESSP